MTDTPHDTRHAERLKREAAALRDNLRRRKRQTRPPEPPAPTEEPTQDCTGTAVRASDTL